MWTVKWMSQGHENTILDGEDYALHNPDVVLEACRMRLSGIQEKNPAAEIDGFVVVDGDGEIVRSHMPGRRPR